MSGLCDIDGNVSLVAIEKMGNVFPNSAKLLQHDRSFADAYVATLRTI